MKRPMFTTYLIALHLLLGLILWKSDFIPKVMARLAGKPHTGELSKHYHNMRAYHARSAEIIPEGSVFFIGDSVIQGLCVDAIIQPAVNYGIGGDTTTGVLERMGDYAFDRASAVVLSIGGNDLNYRDPEAVAANMEKIIARIDPRLPVVMSSILPVDENARPAPRGNNTTITRMNILLQRLAANSPRLFYADLSNFMEAGQLRGELHGGDGMHLNNKGNSILAANLRTAVLRALRKQQDAADTAMKPASH